VLARHALEVTEHPVETVQAIEARRQEPGQGQGQHDLATDEGQARQEQAIDTIEAGQEPIHAIQAK
jgi:hypothetical protein